MFSSLTGRDDANDDDLVPKRYRRGRSPTPAIEKMVPVEAAPLPTIHPSNVPLSALLRTPSFLPPRPWRHIVSYLPLPDVLSFAFTTRTLRSLLYSESARVRAFKILYERDFPFSNQFSSPAREFAIAKTGPWIRSLCRKRTEVVPAFAASSSSSSRSSSSSSRRRHPSRRAGSSSVLSRLTTSTAKKYRFRYVGAALACRNAAPGAKRTLSFVDESSVLIVGAKGVGKSSLVWRLVHGEFLSDAPELVVDELDPIEVAEEEEGGEMIQESEEELRAEAAARAERIRDLVMNHRPIRIPTIGVCRTDVEFDFSEPTKKEEEEEGEDVGESKKSNLPRKPAWMIQAEKKPPVPLRLVEIGGSRRFAGLVSSSVRSGGTCCAIVCVGPNSESPDDGKSSVDFARAFVAEVRRWCPQITLFIAQTKCDARNFEPPSLIPANDPSSGRRFVWDVSARTGENVRDFFGEVAKVVEGAVQAQLVRSSAAQRRRRRLANL